MPEYAGFTLRLISQYDAAAIPEDGVRVTSSPPPLIPDLSAQRPDTTPTQDSNKDVSGVVAETQVPVYPRSQFWLAYECPPPDDDDDEVKFYFLTLCVRGVCVVSWGVGAREGWRGKMMFGLFDGGRDFEGRRIVEKRGLFFSRGGGEGFEVRVFRARGRRRTRGVYGEDAGKGRGGVEFTAVGSAQKGEVRRWFQYALVDARDEPFVTFRYRFERGEDENLKAESRFPSASAWEDTTATTEDTAEPEVEATESSLWSDLEQNTPQARPLAEVESDSTTSSLRRLSFPPRNILAPTRRSTQSSSPTKRQLDKLVTDGDPIISQSSAQSAKETPGLMIAGQASPSARRTTGLRKPEWTAVRTASPLGTEERVLPVAHKKSASGSGGGLLKSVVASALKRREEKSK